jgi:hypothetical protein
MTEQELEKALSDKNYILKLLASNSPEELKLELLNKNIKISLNDAKEILSEVAKNKDTCFQQINDSSLENISGGKSAAYYISRPTYYTGYAIGKIPIVGIIAYNMVKGAVEQLKSDL